MRALSTAPPSPSPSAALRPSTRAGCRSVDLPVGAIRHRVGRARRRSAALAATAGKGAPSPRIEITPSLAQYRQLCRDLKKLRKLGAASHTAAIVSAVHAAAVDNLAQGKHEQAGSH